MRRLLLLSLVLLVAPIALAQWPTVPFVQSMSGSGGACTYHRNVTSGDIEFVQVSWESTTNLPTLTSTQLPSTANWTLDASDTVKTVKVAAFHGVLASSGAEAVTPSVTSGTQISIACLEVPPNWTTTLDASATSNLTIPYSASPSFPPPSNVSTPGVTTTNNNDLVISYIGNNYGRSWCNALAGYQTASLDGSAVESAAIQFNVPVGSFGGLSWFCNNASGTSQIGTGLTVAYLPNALTITTTTMPDGALSSAYYYKLLAAGGTATLTWSITSGSLQSGLSLNSATGEITGTPTRSSSSTITFQVTDGTHTATQTIMLKVSGAFNTPTLVQSVGWSTGSDSSLTFSGNVTAGDAIITSSDAGTSLADHSYCTDTLGTPFAKVSVQNILNPTGLGDYFLEGATIEAGIAPSTGADTVSCYSTRQISEWSSINFVAGDNTNVTRGIDSSFPSTDTATALTTLWPDEIVYGVCSTFNGSATPTMTVQSPFTQIGAAVGASSGYQLASTVGSYSMSCVQTNTSVSNWLISLNGFRPSGGAVVNVAVQHRAQVY